MFGFGIHQQFTLALFEAAPRRDQDAILQKLYDEGYSGKEIARFCNMKEATVYNRINAHRGRGVSQGA